MQYIEGKCSTSKADEPIGCDHFVCFLGSVFRHLQYGTASGVCVSCSLTGATQTVQRVLPPLSGIAPTTLPPGALVLPGPHPPLFSYTFMSLPSIYDAQLSPSLPPFCWSCSSSPFPPRHSHTVATVPPTAAAVAAATAATIPTAGKPAASHPWHRGYRGSCGQRGAAMDAV